MEYYIRFVIAMILALSITFADKIDLLRKDYIFGFMTILLIYNFLFMYDHNPGLVFMYVALYLVIWSSRLINKRNNSQKIIKEIKNDLGN